jgi:hypothetical protein
MVSTLEKDAPSWILVKLGEIWTQRVESIPENLPLLQPKKWPIKFMIKLYWEAITDSYTANTVGISH